MYLHISFFLFSFGENLFARYDIFGEGNLIHFLIDRITLLKFREGYDLD